MRASRQLPATPNRRVGLGFLTSPKRSGSVRSIVSTAAATAAAAYLLYLHSLLLAERLSDLSILEPVVAVKWIASLLILVVLLKFRLAGIPLLKGRKALVVWMLVLLLHCQISAPIGPEVSAEFAAQQNVWLIFLLPALVSIVVSLALSTGRVLKSVRRSQSQRSAAILFRRRLSPRPRLLAGFSLAILSRPPPA